MWSETAAQMTLEERGRRRKAGSRGAKIDICAASEGLLDVEEASCPNSSLATARTSIQRPSNGARGEFQREQTARSSEMLGRGNRFVDRPAASCSTAPRPICVKCHGPSQLGDGQKSDYDDWTKPLVDLAKQVADAEVDSGGSGPEGRERAKQMAAVNAKAAALEHDSLPPRNIIPRNLRLGIYRGGRRPLDLYRRLYAGINGRRCPAWARHRKARLARSARKKFGTWWTASARCLTSRSASRRSRQKFSGREQL